MALQILYAKEAGRELKFGDFKDTVNLTEFLETVVGDLFVEKKYFEDEEEITYKVIDYKTIVKLSEKIKDHEDKIFNEIKNTRGNEKKQELILKLKDLVLLSNVIIKALLQECKNTAKLVVLF